MEPMIPSTTPAREMTEWFPAHVEPVHDGVYQLLNTSTGAEFFARWMGGLWMVGSLLANDAARYTRPSVVQYRWQWRGLKEPT